MVTQTDNCKAKADKTSFGAGQKAQSYPTVKPLAKNQKGPQAGQRESEDSQHDEDPQTTSRHIVNTLHPSGGGTKTHNVVV